MITGGKLTEPFNPRADVGIHDGIAFEDYLSWPYVSQSALKPMLVSPAHYRHSLGNPPDPDKDCFRFGRLCHTGKLEGTEHLMRRYVVQPDFSAQVMLANPECKKPKATNHYRELLAEFARVNADKEVVEQDAFDRFCGILEALNRHALARQWLGADGASEVSLIWDCPVTHIRLKSRLDKLPNDADVICDFKTTSKPITEFSRELSRFSYHLQAAVYCDALQVLTGESRRFGIVVCESNPPFAVQAAVLDDDAIAAGRYLYRRALRQLVKCREEKNRWPGPADPDAWRLPQWAQPEITLTQGGQPLITF